MKIFIVLTSSKSYTSIKGVGYSTMGMQLRLKHKHDCIFVQTFVYSGSTYSGYLASFPGLPTIQLLIAYSVKKQRGGAWSILSHEVTTEGRQRGGEVSLTERIHFVHVFFVLNNKR